MGLRSLVRLLKSLGPSTRKDFSFRDLMTSLVPVIGGTAMVKPLLDSLVESTVMPQLGTSPLTTL